MYIFIYKNHNTLRLYLQYCNICLSNLGTEYCRLIWQLIFLCQIIARQTSTCVQTPVRSCFPKNRFVCHLVFEKKVKKWQGLLSLTLSLRKDGSAFQWSLQFFILQHTSSQDYLAHPFFENWSFCCTNLSMITWSYNTE